MSKGPWLDADPDFNAAAKAQADAMRQAGLTAAEAWYRCGGSQRRHASWQEVERRIREAMRGRSMTFTRASAPIVIRAEKPKAMTFQDDPRAVTDTGSARRLMWA